jgi:outer membrane protein assembly factor BamB
VGSRLVGPAVGAALLIARDAVSGTLTWQISTPGGPIDTAVAGGLVYFGAGSALRVVRLSDGADRGSATPAAGENVRFVTPANGRVFVATTGHLVALAP